MADELEDDGEDFSKLLGLNRRTIDSLERRRAAEECAVKPHYFPRWLQEAGVIAFLDFLLADAGTTPETLPRAKALRDQLTAGQ